jgi:hypothetical protein
MLKTLLIGLGLALALSLPCWVGIWLEAWLAPSIYASEVAMIAHGSAFLPAGALFWLWVLLVSMGVE